MMPNRVRAATNTPPSQKINDLVDRSSSRSLLRGEALGEFTTVTLTLFIEGDEITHANAAVTADVMRRDLTSIQELVQMRATHPEMLGSLAGCQHSCVVDDRELSTLADTTTDREKHVTQLRASAGPRILFQRLKLVGGDTRSLDGLHIDAHMS
jgi:hypothetical protein